MKRWFFNRNGAIVCGRDTLEACKEYAESSIAWDVRLGKDYVQTEFARVPNTYKIEEHTYLWEERRWVHNRDNDIILQRPTDIAEIERLSLPFSKYPDV